MCKDGNNRVVFVPLIINIFKIHPLHALLSHHPLHTTDLFFGK